MLAPAPPTWPALSAFLRAADTSRQLDVPARTIISNIPSQSSHGSGREGGGRGPQHSPGEIGPGAQLNHPQPPEAGSPGRVRCVGSWPSLPHQETALGTQAGRLHVASPARHSQLSERDRAYSSTGVRAPPAAVAEAERPWLPDSGWIGGGHGLGREVPGTSSLAPGLLHQRARSPLVCSSPQSQVASGQLWLLGGTPRDSASLPETELDASIAAPNRSPPPGNQLCGSECPWQQVQTPPTSSQQQSPAFHMQISQWDWAGGSTPPPPSSECPCLAPPTHTHM